MCDGKRYRRSAAEQTERRVSYFFSLLVTRADLSRLGRNSALTGLYTNFTFPQNGVRFIAINDNYDTIDPNRVDNDFAGIKNWFNEKFT